MAINSCSINAHTINSLACRRRNFVIPGPIQQSGGGSVQQFRYNNWNNPYDEESVVNQNLESTVIAITLTMNGKTIEKSYENLPDVTIPMVAVTDIKVDLINPDITVSNLTINRK